MLIVIPGHNGTAALEKKTGFVAATDRTMCA